MFSSIIFFINMISFDQAVSDFAAKKSVQSEEEGGEGKVTIVFIYS